jgi:hypothetical protein
MPGYASKKYRLDQDSFHQANPQELVRSKSNTSTKSAISRKRVAKVSRYTIPFLLHVAMDRRRKSID